MSKLSSSVPLTLNKHSANNSVSGGSIYLKKHYLFLLLELQGLWISKTWYSEQTCVFIPVHVRICEHVCVCVCEGQLWVIM